MHSPEAKALNAISLDDATFKGDLVHESAKHMFAQRKKYAQWLDADDPLGVANALLLMIGRAMNMLKRQIEAQGKAFEESGGFSERLTQKRIEARAQPHPDAPPCPLCQKQMRLRRSSRGEFWGCSAYPDCKGLLPLTPEA